MDRTAWRAWILAVGAIVVSVIGMGAFLVGMTLAYRSGKSTELYDGAIINMLGTVVSFWIGSSVGSRSKEDKLAAQAAPAVVAASAETKP